MADSYTQAEINQLFAEAITVGLGRLEKDDLEMLYNIRDGRYELAEEREE